MKFPLLRATLDRDRYLKRALALQLLTLDGLLTTFQAKALDGDVASGTLVCKLCERVATLLGLNAPIGHTVRVISHAPPNQPTATDRIEKVINDLLAEQAKTDPTSH